MVDITSDPPPPFNLCPGETILLISNVTGGTPPYTYLWADGSTGSTTVVTPPYVGEFPLDVTDAIGCVASNSIHIKASVWTVDIFYTPLSLCVGDSMALYAYPDFPPGTTFLWSTGESSSSIFITTSGTYSLTATAPGGACSSSFSEYIEMPFFPQPDPTISGPTVLCPGQNGTLTAQGNSDDIYNWSTGQQTSSIIISGPDIYSVTVTNSFGCFAADSIEVLPGSTPPIISAPLILCNGQNGTIEITNASSYTDFLWSTGENTSSIVITSPGTYSVTVTAQGGCTATGSVTVNSGNSNISLDGITLPVTSCVPQNGAVDLTVTPSGTYSFSWSNGDTSEDISNLSSGTYTVTVTDIGGCTSSAAFTVTSDVVLPTTSTSFTPTSCDLNNGAIDLSVAPAGSYTFSWSNAETTEDLSDILAGTYSVTVTSSANGCTATAIVTVPNINPVIDITGNTTPFSSCTMPNGAIDITISPAGTYSFTWSNGETTEDLGNLVAGNYTVTVSAGGSCTSSAAYTVADITVPPVPNASVMTTTCGQSNGAVDLTITPPGSYTFLWSNGATTEDLTNIFSGTYSVTVTSSVSGCTATETVSVENINPEIIITGDTSPLTSCTSPNGAIDISLSPSGTYTYLWSNGETTQDLDSLEAGSYTVTATLGVSCSQVATFQVSDNINPILLSANTTPNTSCAQPNGAIDLTVDPPGLYTFSWSNGAVTEDLDQLTGGIYAVTVTGNDGCTASSIFEVLNSSSNFTVEGTISSNYSCTSPNGSIDLNIIPSGTYSFSWSNSETTEDIDQLPAGTYGVTVSDINNCSSIAVFSITDSLTFPVVTAQIFPESCGNSNGAIDLTSLSGTGNTFAWSNGETTEDISGLTSGIYTVTVTSENGCTIIQSYTVTAENSNFSLSGLIIPNSHCLLPNGAIDLTLTPPGTYSFTWSTSASTEDLSGLAPGLYTVTIADVSNCLLVDSFLVNETLSLPALSSSVTPALCGGDNGAVDLLVMPPDNIIFLWSNGQPSEDLQNIGPGTYIIIATDTITGCASSDTIIVQNINSNFSISTIPSANSSCVSPDGAIDLSVSPAGAYTFLWSTGASTEDLSNLASGVYSVTVTDATACSSSEMIFIPDSTVSISVAANITPSSCGINNGSIDLTILPAAGYSFLWSTGDASEDLQNLLPGDYFVTISGPGGCTALDTFTITDESLQISLSAITTANSSCTSPAGTIDLSVTPTGTFTYLWSTGSSSQDLDSLLPGIYTVTVSDLSGCSTSASFIIDNEIIIPLIEAAISPSSCGNNNGFIDITVTPADTYLFSWSTGAMTEDLNALAPGFFSVTVTGASGCSSDTTLEVVNSGLTFSISAIPSANTTCAGSDGAIQLIVTPDGNYTFQWSNGAISEDLFNVSAGIYSVSVTDQSGCSTSGQYIVENDIIPLVVEEVITPTSCGDPNGAIALTTVPASGNSFIWSNGATTEDLTNLPGGQYAVTVTAQNGCSWSSSFNIPESESIQITLEADAFPLGSGFITITAQLNVPVSALDTLIWLPEELFSCSQEICLEQTITRPAGNTEIRVIAVDTNGCQAIDYLVLDEFSNPAVYIPNVFSPNGDGVNDFFTVYGNKDVKTIVEMQIFDRWGNQVFVKNEFPPNEENYGWDGLFRNKAMNPAVFAFWARVRYIDGTEEFFKGDVTLVR